MLVSVIMPFYNRASVIENAIESVLKQTYKNWELLLIDDGSTDSSESIIRKIKDDRLRYIKLEKNKGACYARNVGLKNANGEVIGFLDSDNIWDSTFLSARLADIQDNHADFVFGRYCLIYENGEKIIFPDVPAEDIRNRQFADKYLLKENLVDTNTVLMTRKCFETIGFFDENLKRYQDWDYFGRIFGIEDIKYAFQENILATGFMQKNGISNTISHWDARIQLLYKNLDKIYKLNMSLEVVEYLYDVSFYYYDISEEQKEKVVAILTLEDYIQLLENKKEKERQLLISKSQLLISKKEVASLRANKSWLFYEEYFPENARILIYGYGDVGQDFVYQILRSKKLQLVGVIDKKICAQKKDNVSFYNIGDIQNLQFDYIVIAILAREIAYTIREQLILSGVKKEKIVWHDFTGLEKKKIKIENALAYTGGYTE